MNIEWDSQSITIKKFLSRKVIDNHDIIKITFDLGKIVINTKDGGKYVLIDTPFRGNRGEVWDLQKHIFKLVRSNNIEYENLNELSEPRDLYVIGELTAKFDHTAEVARQCGSAYVKSHLGEEYDFECHVDEDMDTYSLFFVIARNGAPLDIPENKKLETWDEFPDAYDSCMLAYLCHWDSTRNEGEYGLAKETEDDPSCVMYVEKSLSDMIAELGR